MSPRTDTVARFIAAVILLFAPGCGGGSLAPVAAPLTAPESQGTRSIQVAPLPTGPISVVSYGGLKGLTFTAHTDGSTYD